MKHILQIIENFMVEACRPTKRYIKKKLNEVTMKRESERLMHLEPAEQRLFYLGITAHSNLGDMAQHYCIRKWICENFGDYKLEMFEADPVVYTKFEFIKRFKAVYRPQDIILFQSGYTTQDLGGRHNLMHEMVAEALTEAKILMMPQTIFFKEKKNQDRTAKILNSTKNMLFLARDFVSFETAKQMMPDVHVEAFPDIVTTLIGTLKFCNKRDGVCLCRRNDGEKYYSEEELMCLKADLETLGRVDVSDTSIKVSASKIRRNMKYYIEQEIEKYSHYKVTITDRYHGTIFSLAAGTPVIIIKTTDHKVTTGADWFKGIYDDYVFVAEDLNDAYLKAKVVVESDDKPLLSPYFKETYYDNLKSLFIK